MQRPTSTRKASEGRENRQDREKGKGFTVMVPHESFASSQGTVPNQRTNCRRQSGF